VSFLSMDANSKGSVVSDRLPVHRQIIETQRPQQRNYERPSHTQHSNTTTTTITTQQHPQPHHSSATSTTERSTRDPCTHNSMQTSTSLTPHQPMQPCPSTLSPQLSTSLSLPHLPLPPFPNSSLALFSLNSDLISPRPCHVPHPFDGFIVGSFKYFQESDM